MVLPIDLSCLSRSMIDLLSEGSIESAVIASALLSLCFGLIHLGRGTAG